MSTQNIFTIERTTGVVTATQNPLLVYNDVIPISVAFTNSAVVDETLMPRRAALSVSLRLGSASGVIIAQAIQFSHAAGYASATLQLSPESQDRVYLSDGVVWLEFNLSEKTGPSSKHTIESEINTASAGGVADLVDAALTGTTSVQVLSPDIADLGTVSSGTVTLSSTKSVNKVTLSGSAATIALPSSPPDGWRTLHLTTSDSVVTLTIPSLKQEDGDGVTTTTSVQFPANCVGTLAFKAIAGSYVSFSASGSSLSIPTSALNVSTDSTLAAPSASKVVVETILAAYVAGLLDGLTIVSTDIIDVPARSVIGRYAATAGVAQLITFGSGLSLNTSTGVLTATATGTNTPVEITGTEIDWGAGTRRFRALSGSVTFTFANIVDGQSIKVLLTAVGGSRTPTWPANVDWGTPGAPTIASGNSIEVDLTPWSSGALVAASVRVPAITKDVTPPTYVSSEIPTGGTTVIDTYSETLSATITTTTGRTITMSGGAVTLSSPVASGSTVTWTTSRTIIDGETCSANAYTQPGTGIKDSAGNYAGSYSGRQADVANNSTASTYLIDEDFEGTGTPTSMVAGAGTHDFHAVRGSDLNAGSGNKCLSVNSNSLAPYALFTAMDELWCACRMGDCALPMRLRNGTTNVAWYQHSTNHRAYIGGSFTGNTGTLPANPVYVKLHYRKGISGVQNQLLECWVSTTGTWGSPVVTRNVSGDSSAVNRIYFGPEFAGSAAYIDDFILSATDIPDGAIP